jgi:hypothetical protein
LKAGVTSDSIPIELLDRMVNDLVALGQRLHAVASQLAKA